METTSSIEDISPISKKLKVTIGKDLVEGKFQENLKNVAKKAKIKGFRPGKVPQQIVEKMYGPSARYDALNDLISESLSSIVSKNEFPMVGRPEVSIDSADPGSDLQYTATIAVVPAPKISGYDKFNVSVPRLKITKEEVEKRVEELRKREGKLKDVTDRDTVRAEDLVSAVAEVFVDGESSGRPEQTYFIVGDGRLPKEVEAGVIGQKVGEEKEISFTADESYPVANARGKKVLYKMKVEKISERELPELNDEFAAKAFEDVKTVAELKKKVKELAEKESEDKAKQSVQTKILEQILEKNDFEVPQPLVDVEIKEVLARLGFFDPQRQDIKEEAMAQFRQSMDEAARKRVRTTIAIDRIIEQEKITASKEDLDKEIADTAEKVKVSKEEVEKVFLSPGNRKEIEQRISRDKCLAMLESKAKIKYEDVDVLPAEG